MNIHPIVLIIGTRPEGIKMAPMYHALKKANLPVVVISTLQHDQLLRDVLQVFNVTADFELNIMRLGQDLFYVTQSVLQKTKEIYKQINPSLVLGQGDSTSSMAAALSAFYLNIPVGHIEAGLRTDDIRAPFPEEMNRRVISTIAQVHFAPTQAALENVLAHGIHHSRVFNTGNTVVDALRIIKDQINSGIAKIDPILKKRVESAKKENKKIMLLTAHRRESFDGGIERVLQTVKVELQNNKNFVCFYPYHPNPHVVQAIERTGLAQLSNLHLSEPLSYEQLMFVLDAADIVLTDSGGIQEEAVSLGKPVLVLREKTERMEGVLTGLAHIVGTDIQKIKDGIVQALAQTKQHIKQFAQVYGDGYAAEKIIGIIRATFKFENTVSISVQNAEIINNKKVLNVRGGAMNVCILGLGYIGLPTAIVAAEHGCNVIGVDIDAERAKKINAGDPVIYEPEVYEKLQLVLQEGSLRATTVPESADYFVIAVPTPITSDKKIDLSYVMKAAESIVSVLRKDNVVIVESTVNVGATEKVAHYLQEKTGLEAGKDFYVAHCPERVLPGKIFHELVHNDRIIGGINKKSVEKAKKLYKQFVQGKLYLTDAKTAEMVKLVENSSRDVQIAFAHQVASMAYSIGADPYRVIELANKHPRVNILQPTCGVGGHCIAVDPWFLIESFPKHTQLIKAAREVNDTKPQEIIRFIEGIAQQWQQEHTGTCNVLLLGLTYKPNIDDLRESPALYIARTMIKNMNVRVMVSEPHVSAAALQKMFGSCAVNITDGVQQADVVVFLVAHDRFKAIDHKLLANKKVLDFCGVLHTPHQEVDQESMFWPARSIMDFFIVNQQETLNQEIKEDSA